MSKFAQAIDLENVQIANDYACVAIDVASDGRGTKSERTGTKSERNPERNPKRKRGKTNENSNTKIWKDPRKILDNL